MRKQIDEINALTYAKRQRLEFIESKLYSGSLNRGDIRLKFGVSMPQASRDIQDYIKLFPKAVKYNLSSKCYEKDKGFKFNLTGDELKSSKLLRKTKHQWVKLIKYWQSG